MGRAIPSPVFAVCACGRHGRLITPDGRVGMEAYSRKLARLTIWVAYEEGRITKEDLARLDDGLSATDLPKSNDEAYEADPDLCRRVHEWNDALIRGKALDPDRFHQEDEP